MRLLQLSILCFLFSGISYSQQVTLVTNLNNSIKETSGLISINQKLITHNDSGGEPELYEIDSLTGNVSRTVVIGNASNVDWEGICTDSFNIYIGDFGNNNGTRTNLRIYKISISDYLTTPNDTVYADTIAFNYTDQTSFVSSTYTTNFDAEGFISFNDSLYIFTKNWGNSWTNIYPLPKIPGNYASVKMDSINTQGLITGATYNSSDNSIGLIGYTFSNAFHIKVNQFSGNNFSGGSISRVNLTVPASFQIESISSINSNQYYLTAEEHSSGNSSLYRLSAGALGINTFNSASTSFYPNPVKEKLHINSKNMKLVRIYNASGKKLISTDEKIIDVSFLKPGLYFVQILFNNNELGVINKMIVQ